MKAFDSRKEKLLFPTRTGESLFAFQIGVVAAFPRRQFAKVKRNKSNNISGKLGKVSYGKMMMKNNKTEKWKTIFWFAGYDEESESAHTHTQKAICREKDVTKLSFILLSCFHFHKRRTFSINASGAQSAARNGY